MKINLKPTRIDQLIKLLHPVGDIYFSTNSANPATYFGVGTWVPYGAGRTIIGAGQLVWSTTVANTAITIASDTITVTANDSLQTGTPVVLSTTGTAPTGLTAGSIYYVIKVSSTSIKLASNLSNAVAGSAIDITGQGTGNHTLTLTGSTRNAGDVGGEEVHANTITETAAHGHSITLPSYASSTATSGHNGWSADDYTYSSATNNTAQTGGSGAHNNMPPYIVTYIWQRTA